MSMDDRDGFIWFDGKMVPWREATVHVLTHTLHYGMGCFEGVRAYQTDRGAAIFALEAHTLRLLDSCKVLGMPITYNKQQLMDAQISAVRDNQLKSAYPSDGVFRLRGNGLAR
jgi:branched-chain amino acid aminotransferase